MMTQLRHEQGEMHCDKRLVFDDEHLHRYRAAGNGTISSIM
jgi:hypothetical protein